MYVKGCMYVCLELTLKWRFSCRLLVRECYSDQPEWKKMEVKLGKGRNLGMNQSQEGFGITGSYGTALGIFLNWGERPGPLYSGISPLLDESCLWKIWPRARQFCFIFFCWGNSKKRSGNWGPSFWNWRTNTLFPQGSLSDASALLNAWEFNMW